MTGQRSGSKCCLQMDQFIFSYKVCLNSTMHSSITFLTKTLALSLSLFFMAIDLGEHSVGQFSLYSIQAFNLRTFQIFMFYRSRFSCLSFYLSVFTISHQYNKTFLHHYCNLPFWNIYIKVLLSAEGNYFVPLFTISSSASGCFYLECASMPTVKCSTSESIYNHLNCFPLLCTAAISGHAVFQGHGWINIKYLFLYVFTQIVRTEPCYHLVVNIYGLHEYMARRAFG